MSSLVGLQGAGPTEIRRFSGVPVARVEVYMNWGRNKEQSVVKRFDIYARTSQHRSTYVDERLVATMFEREGHRGAIKYFAQC